MGRRLSDGRSGNSIKIKDAGKSSWGRADQDEDGQQDSCR